MRLFLLILQLKILHAGYVSKFPPVFSRMTVEENLAMGGFFAERDQFQELSLIHICASMARKVTIQITACMVVIEAEKFLYFLQQMFNGVTLHCPAKVEAVSRSQESVSLTLEGADP